MREVRQLQLQASEGSTTCRAQLGEVRAFPPRKVQSRLWPPRILHDTWKYGPKESCEVQEHPNLTFKLKKNSS